MNIYDSITKLEFYRNGNKFELIDYKIYYYYSANCNISINTLLPG